MNEVEVKILEVDIKAIVKKLEGMGAKKVFDGRSQARYFDYPDGRLKSAKSVLRLRSKGELVELAFKRKNSDDKTVKSREETEVNVSDLETMGKILLALGMVELEPGLNKHRASYALEDAHFEFDTYEGVPTYLEIEAHSVERARYWVEKLGFSMRDTKPWTGKDVVKHYGKWPG
jgi:adenylate cyclase, class 2